MDDSAVESQHSIIAIMLDWTAMANNLAVNNNSMNIQYPLLSQFKSDMYNLEPINCQIVDLYNFYCHHTGMAQLLFQRGKHDAHKPLRLYAK